MAKPRVLILRAPGTNCDEETAYAFEQAGGDAVRLHVNRALENARGLSEFQILCIPGGFSYGDDIAAGRIFANQLSHHLADALREFRAAGKLILGICNGFQVLLKAGLLFDDEPGRPSATLTWNDRGRFEDRWVHLAVEPGPCEMLRGITKMELPIAHAEGKFVARDAAVLQRLKSSGRIVLRYAKPGQREGDVPFPNNPNGSQANVAGLCDPTGRVLGMMPHPERFIHATHHPQWTRRQSDEPGDGLRLFANAVNYFR